MLLRQGHGSVIEHGVASVRFITNRGVTHELVRHRIASFSQESTRYVRYDGQMEFIQPVWWDIDGHKTEVPLETKRALLTAMGIDYSNARVAWDSLYGQMERKSGPYPIAGNYLTQEIEAKTKLFGLSAHLYTLKSKNDTGCGDFATLAEYCKFTQSVGAYAAGINPLHHLFPTDRERMSPYQPSDRRFIDPIMVVFVE